MSTVELIQETVSPPVCLSHEVGIIIPLEFAESIKYVSVGFANLLGGFTRYNASGGWVDSNGALICEEVCIILASCKDLECLGFVYGLARDVKKDCKQESVAVKIDGKLYLI